MEDRARKLTGSSEPSKANTSDLDTLLHPASAFAHPMDVVRDADLTLNEKRAILVLMGIRCLCGRSNPRFAR
jgi:hypothetical protein